VGLKFVEVGGDEHYRFTFCRAKDDHLDRSEIFFCLANEFFDLIALQNGYIGLEIPDQRVSLSGKIQFITDLFHLFFIAADHGDKGTFHEHLSDKFFAQTITRSHYHDMLQFKFQWIYSSLHFGKQIHYQRENYENDGQ
jgi:hypothetical protein